MSLLKKIVAVIIAVVCAAGIAIGLNVVAYSPQAPVIISTRDEATHDEATPDSATYDEVEPTNATNTTAPSETPTEMLASEGETYIRATEVVSSSNEEVEETQPNQVVENGSGNDNVTQESIDYSKSDLDLLARVILAEAGGCSEQCQWLVASTIMNLADELGDGTLESIVYNTNIVYISYSTPDEQCYRVAARVLSGDRDYQVKAFRSDYYHDFGTPYTSVDNVYFSTF